MKLATVFLGLSLAASLTAAASTTCEKPLEFQIRQHSDLTLDLRAGDIEVVGGEGETLQVDCIVSHGASEITVEFDAGSGRLKVENGPEKNVRIHIRIPKETNLTLRCSAGDVEVRNVRGDKDFSLRAGDLTVDTGRPEEYRSVEASVNAGDIHASAFGVHKGGLFRSFSKQNPTGRYILKAKLWAGDIHLR